MRFTWRRAAHALLALAGLVAVVWGAIALAHPSITCRGVQMHPGDVCETSSFSQLGSGKVQTYEQRVSNARLSQPFVIGTGVLVAAFGATLLVQDIRRGRQTTAADPARRTSPSHGA